MQRRKSTSVWYDAEEDIVGIQIREGQYWKSVEVSDNVVVDLSKDGEIIGIEILRATQSLKEAAPLVLAKAG